MSAIEILLVEDSPADVLLTTEALKDTTFKYTLHVAQDGESALEHMRDPSSARPDLVLLDLNLPGLDGREVLAEMRADPALTAIPVCILTTSQADDDIARAYELHASCYVVKPFDLHQFNRVVSAIEHFWFSIAKLPPRDEKRSGRRS